MPRDRLENYSWKPGMSTCTMDLTSRLLQNTIQQIYNYLKNDGNVTYLRMLKITTYYSTRKLRKVTRYDRI